MFRFSKFVSSLNTQWFRYISVATEPDISSQFTVYSFKYSFQFLRAFSVFPLLRYFETLRQCVCYECYVGDYVRLFRSTRRFGTYKQFLKITITNYSQQDATFLEFIYFFPDALHVSGGSSTHHQEHITVHTASGIVNQYCC
jgi:hypothetical protein